MDQPGSAPRTGLGDVLGAGGVDGVGLLLVGLGGVDGGQRRAVHHNVTAGDHLLGRGRIGDVPLRRGVRGNGVTSLFGAHGEETPDLTTRSGDHYPIEICHV